MNDGLTVGQATNQPELLLSLIFLQAHLTFTLKIKVTLRENILQHFDHIDTQVRQISLNILYTFKVLFLNNNIKMSLKQYYFEANFQWFLAGKSLPFFPTAMRFLV